MGALEFRCCREVVDVLGNMAFDGSIEKISCITEHEDYGAMTNRAVLLQVGPLLKHRVSENELQQFASKHKPQTFSRVCLRLKLGVYRWKRKYFTAHVTCYSAKPNSVIFHVLMCFRVRFSILKLTIL